jgi:hypothetical protein
MDIFAKVWNSYRVVLSVIAGPNESYQWELRLARLDEESKGEVVAEGYRLRSFSEAAADGMKAVSVFDSDFRQEDEPPAQAAAERRAILH